MLKTILDLFTQGAGQRVGQVVTFAALAAALTPLGIWVWTNRADQVTCFTIGDLMTYGFMMIPVIVIIYCTSARRTPGG